MEGTLETMARAATAFFLILLVGSASLLAVATPADAASKPKPCWKQLIDDWSTDGQIDGSYSARCVDEALAKVPEDIRAYSNFEEQAKAARQAASRSLQGPIVSGSNSDGSSDARQPREREPNTAKDETPVGWALGTRGNNADSVPIPLLVLLGLAGALITAGGAGFAARKLQAHRASR